jgi:cation diffusion facilitator CzcD-associated flavoprotein CzcO
MKKTSSKYGADQYTKFKHEIKSAIWDETAGKWNLKVNHGDQTFDDKCDVFINAGGVLKYGRPNVSYLHYTEVGNADM